ncbi:unnamed protein product [Rhizoctonia solani]|uniref:MYND-type domain-containing protein n=1 Tax=Rhizoctonia solani TaxID=456999 RepID=A0A8H3DZJ3_9AGAM|nr:unnamed protein product [Rhizoctonia solani]
MLKSVLQLCRFPTEFENFALPSLATGSIVLMSSIQPTPFSYEYGYLCFRILVFSLNACLIKHGRNLSFTIRRMSDAPSGTHLDLFWLGTGDLILGELSPIEINIEKPRRLTDILEPGRGQLPILKRSSLGTLLELLHKDQKNFLVAVMSADSLHLSGLMFVLFKYLEIEQKTRQQANYTQKLFLPFSRIFRRYRLVFPETYHETTLLRLIYNTLPAMSDLQDKTTVDAEDSRNVIQAYNRSLKTYQTINCKDAIHYMGFVAPLFVPGCEELIPSTLESTFLMLWTIGSKADPDMLATITQGYGVCFWQLFDRFLRPSRSSLEPWRFGLVNAMIKCDIVGLIFRVAFRFSETQTISTERATEARIKDFFDTMLSFWGKAVDYTPEEYFEQQMMASGVIDNWLRFFAESNERLDPDSSSAVDIILIPFSMLFSNVMVTILGTKWRTMKFDHQVTGICDYPRCPHPTNASTRCSKCINSTYCSPRCLAKYVNSGFGGI